MQWYELIDLAQDAWSRRDLKASELRLFDALHLLNGAESYNDRRIVPTLELLTELLIRQGKLREAEPHLYRLLDAQMRLPNVRQLSIALTLQRLAEAAYYQLLYARAINLESRALTIYMELVGSNRLEVAESAHRLARYYQAAGQQVQADICFKQSVASFAQAKDGDCASAKLLIESYSAFLQTMQNEDGLRNQLHHSGTVGSSNSAAAIAAAAAAAANAAVMV